jgi:hypothetical protein
MAMLTRPQLKVDAARVQSSSDCAWITDYSEGNQRLFEAGALKRGDGKGFAVAGELGEFLGRDEIDLVQDVNDRLGRDPKLG